MMTFSDSSWMCSLQQQHDAEEGGRIPSVDLGVINNLGEQADSATNIHNGDPNGATLQHIDPPMVGGGGHIPPNYHHSTLLPIMPTFGTIGADGLIEILEEAIRISSHFFHTGGDVDGDDDYEFGVMDDDGMENHQDNWMDVEEDLDGSEGEEQVETIGRDLGNANQEGDDDDDDKHPWPLQ